MARTRKHTYLKEIEIKYKIKKINDKVIGKKVTDATIIAELFADLQNETKEKFLAINLDTKNKILCFEVVAIGSVRAIYLRPMEVFRTSIIVNATSVILVHNHPSGEPQPSPEDVNFTMRCQRIADDLGVELYDHIIIGLDSYYSFAREGVL
ncbi:MAG: JAB domain-containing protein [Candidatus Kapaibacterium sp.]